MTTHDLLTATIRSIENLDPESIDRMAERILTVHANRGRIFLAGSGGGAAHASHGAADFRKLCGLEAYCVSDNVAELTARTNDDGWDKAYAMWLRVSRIGAKDALLVISVGGGSLDPPVSANLVYALDCANQTEATTLAIVGRDGGFAGKYSDVTVLVSCDVPALLTPVVESVQALILHALAVHPRLAINKAKWEGLA